MLEMTMTMTMMTMMKSQMGWPNDSYNCLFFYSKAAVKNYYN